MTRYMRLFAYLALFRLSSVYIVASWFVPDEIYQSSEIAHKLVYGTGHETWEWTTSLRSYLHPALIATVYQFLNFLGLSSSRSLIYHGPRIIHSLLFAISDLSFYNICRRLCKTTKIAELSFISYISCWFVYYCAPRTLSNSLETSLTLIALNWFPFEGPLYKRATWPYIALGTITIILRPTVSLIWFIFGLHHIIFSKSRIRLIVHTVLPSSVPILLLSILIDSWAYDRVTVPLWNFLQFNVVQGGSAFFGVHPWYWYILSGIPAVLTVQMAPVIIGLLGPNIFRPTLLPFYASIFYITVHSFLPHKEQRFLLPIIPLLCIYTGGAFQNLKKWQSTAVSMVVAINVAIVVFTSRYHQVGPFSASKRILEEWKSHEKISIAALMPCYSLPGHAYWHDQLDTLRMLDCSPDLENSRAINELDEADQFHANGTAWLSDIFSKEHMNYQRILIYEKIFDLSSAWFHKNGWHQCMEKIWHSFFLTSSREDNYIIVLCRNDRV